MTALDLSADVGLLTVFLATANICLGLLIAVRYSPSRLWPHRRANIFAVHTWTAYFLMTFLLIHPVILLFSTQTHWRLLDLALPIWSSVQPIENTIGAVSLYLIVVVVVTSYFRVRIGRPAVEGVPLPRICSWGRYVHHGILADLVLKGNAVDRWMEKNYSSSRAFSS